MGLVRPAAQRFGELIEESDLGGVDDRAGSFEGVPGAFVDFGESFHPARSAGPFEFEGIADQLCRVEVAGNRPGIDAFAAFLADGAEGLEVTFELDAGLFAEFADGGVEGGFLFGEFALGDGPGAGILFLPEGSAGVNEEDFGGGLRGGVGARLRGGVGGRGGWGGAQPVKEDSGGLFCCHYLLKHTKS